MIIPKREKKDIKTTSVSSIAMKPMRHFVILSTSITSILPLRPTDVHSMRNRKAWWICKEGYEWQASPHNRMAGRGCPFCNQHKVIPTRQACRLFGLKLQHNGITKGMHRMILVMWRHLVTKKSDGHVIADITGAQQLRIEAMARGVQRV